MKLSITTVVFLICSSTFAQQNDPEKSTATQPVKRVTKVEKAPLRAAPSKRKKVLAPLTPVTTPVEPVQQSSTKKEEEGN